MADITEAHKKLVEIIKRLNDPEKPVYATEDKTVNVVLSDYIGRKHGGKSTPEYITSCTEDEATALADKIASAYRNKNWSEFIGEADKPAQPAVKKAATDTGVKVAPVAKKTTTKPTTGSASLDELVQGMIDCAIAGIELPEAKSEGGASEVEARVKALEERLEKQAAFIKTFFTKYQALEKKVEALSAPTTSSEGELDL